MHRALSACFPVVHLSWLCSWQPRKAHKDKTGWRGLALLEATIHSIPRKTILIDYAPFCPLSIFERISLAITSLSTFSSHHSYMLSGCKFRFAPTTTTTPHHPPPTSLPPDGWLDLLIFFSTEEGYCSIQFSSVPWPMRSSGGHEGRFSR